MKLGILLLSVVPLFAFAGERGGNGGGVHACPEKIELYDFYEGRHPLLHHIRVWESDPRVTVREYLDRALANLKRDVPVLGRYAEIKVNELLALPPDELILPISIPRTPDADIPFVDEGCEYRQVANWNERFDRVVFSRGLFDRLDSMSQAGLYIHEALYKIARDAGRGASSDQVRKLVALAFSATQISAANVQRDILPAGTVAFIPRSGQCQVAGQVQTNAFPQNGLAGEVALSLGNDTSFGLWDASRTSMPCADILQHGLIVAYRYMWRTATGLVSIQVTVNGLPVSLNPTLDRRPVRDLNDMRGRRNAGFHRILPSKFLPLD